MMRYIGLFGVLGRGRTQGPPLQYIRCHGMFVWLGHGRARVWSGIPAQIQMMRRFGMFGLWVAGVPANGPAHRRPYKRPLHRDV